VALGLVGLAFALDRPDPGERPDATAPTSTPTGTSSTAARPSPTDLLAACAGTRQAISHVLDAVGPAMTQWSTHIDAMNQLVAGKITLAQANEFWAQTRMGAHHRFDTYTARDRRLRQSGALEECPPPSAGSSAGSASGSSAGLTACEQAVQASARTLAAARTTLTRWGEHIRDMDRLRAGTLDPAMAQQMWLSMWRKGEAEVRAYRERDRLSSALHCPG
jgi:hypothetical protein